MVFINNVISNQYHHISIKIKLANAEEELHTSQISIATTTSIMKQTWLINEYHQLINGNIKPKRCKSTGSQATKVKMMNLGSENT